MTSREGEEGDKKVTREVEEVESLRKELAEEKARAEANLAGWQRERADFINFRRRVEQEREEMSKFACSSLILRLLPILDDFERAFKDVPTLATETGWVEGIIAIERKLRGILESQGLSPIKALGEPFDTGQHEAAMTGEGKEGVVVGELEKGYKLYDKVLRPAKVIVGQGEPEQKEE